MNLPIASFVLDFSAAIKDKPARSIKLPFSVTYAALPILSRIRIGAPSMTINKETTEPHILLRASRSVVDVSSISVSLGAANQFSIPQAASV